MRRLWKSLRAYARVLFGTHYKRMPELAGLLRRRPAIMAAVSGFETALLASQRVDPALKGLAELKASSLIGCPF